MYSLRWTKWKDIDQEDKEELRNDYFNMSQKDFYRKWDRQQGSFIRFFWRKKTYTFSVNEDSIRDWAEMTVRDFCDRHHITNKTAYSLLSGYPSNINSARRRNEMIVKELWLDAIQGMIDTHWYIKAADILWVAKWFLYTTFNRLYETYTTNNKHQVKL